MSNVAIVIPLYQESISFYEEIALKQCYTVLNNFTIIIVCPKKMESSQFHKSNNHKSIFIFLEDNNFESITSYNHMMLSVWFYKLFSSYSHILIHQLDCFVFKNELQIWVNKNYSYIGAPWFIQNSNDGAVDGFLGVGNGGFSLRNVNHCIKVLSSNKKIHSLKKTILISKPFKNPLNILRGFKSYFFLNTFSNVNQNTTVNEDKIFALAGKRFKFFIIPSPEQAIPFAFEMQPEKLYKQNNKQLPFGCHAWSKYDLSFYKPFIELFGFNLNDKTNN